MEFSEMLAAMTDIEVFLHNNYGNGEVNLSTVQRWLSVRADIINSFEE